MARKATFLGFAQAKKYISNAIREFAGVRRVTGASNRILLLPCVGVRGIWTPPSRTTSGLETLRARSCGLANFLIIEKMHGNDSCRLVSPLIGRGDSTSSPVDHAGFSSGSRERASDLS